MSDPRLFTVKQCQPAYLASSGAAIGKATTDRRNFANSIGKIGDLQILNSVGGGNIGKGLRTLASISNSIRVGCGSLPTSIGSTIDAGARWVMDTIKVPPVVVDAVRAFNPSIANQAYGQAKQLFSKVKQGNFKFTDIPGYMQDFQNLERLGRNIFTPGKGDVQSTASEHCDASPYAVDLIARAPKYKFLFVVQFVVNDGYKEAGSDYGPLDMAFTVKKSTRPTVKYHEEDVNYYNYRSKVITKTEFGEMNMSFHDDTMNLATQFYTLYTRAMTPITNLASMDQTTLEDRMGMDYGRIMTEKSIRNSLPANTYAATRGFLNNDNKTIFKEIRVYHVFDYGHRMNVWRFMNPQITQLAMDELDMSVGTEGTELAMTFTYDSVYIDPDVSMSNNGGKYNLGETQRGAVYQLKYNGAGSVGGPNNAGINPYGTPPVASDACSPMNPTNTSGTNSIGGLISGGGIGGAISQVKNSVSSAISNLSSKFSNAAAAFDSLG